MYKGHINKVSIWLARDINIVDHIIVFENDLP